MTQPFRLLIASDGSPSARAALAFAGSFPWPERVRATGVVSVAESSWRNASRLFRKTFAEALHGEAQRLRDELASHWNAPEVVERNDPPATAILALARSMPADAIALGWRGHGTFKRLLAGSVSRGVVAAAPCAVLVCRSAPRSVRRFVVGFDGRPPSRRAIRFLSRMKPPPENLALVVTAVEPMPYPLPARLPRATRETIRAEVARINQRNVDQARRKSERAAAMLRQAGWHAEPQVLLGAPLASLLDVSAESSVDVLVVGARTTSGMARVPLGSVASGALDRAPVPVVIVP